MDENNMGNNNSIENNNDANGFVMVDNPAPQASQEPQEPQTENQNQNQPVQPEAASQYTQPEPEVTPQYTQSQPEPAQQQNTYYEQPVQPSPMPSEDNTYRFQNVEAQNVKKKKEKIIRRLNTGKLQRDIYVLVLPEHGSNQLEIYNAALFLQPDFPNDDFFVVGIVRGYEAALELVEEIAGKVYEQTGAADIRTYLLEREQEG